MNGVELFADGPCAPCTPSRAKRVAKGRVRGDDEMVIPMPEERA